MAEPDDFVADEVAANQSFSEPGLKRLIDQAAGVGEVLGARVHELTQWHHIGAAVALRRVLHPNDRRPRGLAALLRVDELDLPHSLAAVPAKLLQDSHG